ncbi:patatin-like phospholipase family protein [Herbidospora daliensis]|uniref:patatin-like phospholipase family protein n=1 Tax=Herbidospora daliensis TaxID=295585 RepID=UPI000781548A|nr:patatin-like phospholipase family protein [Herbidospora daliensis]
MTRALVLGGGGIAGIAWEAGIVTGLRREGVDLGAADTIIGTSAGSVVGTLIATGADLEKAVARQSTSDHGPRPVVDMAPVMQAFAILFDPHVEPKEARRRVGELALALPVVDGMARIESVGDRLPVKVWPDRDLQVTAVDAATGQFVVWTGQSGVELALAVASSCAVPCVYPPVEINGARYMDGGVRSGTNADLARGADAVVVLEPLTGMVPPERLARELEKTGASRTVSIGPDAAAKAVFGDNVLDPGLWAPAFKAGLAQAPAVATRVAEIWD